jgi:RNA polymerase sigma-70 factor, ECF subfamily
MTAVDRLEAEAPAPRNDAPGARAADFEAFFTQEHVRLFRALCLLTESPQEAEELMQDAFLKLWERWDRASAMDSPTGYLYRTAMNLVRSRARRVRTAFRTGLRRGPQDDPLEDVEAREVVVRALAILTPRQRAAVVLMDVLDLTSEQAGAALRVKASTVRVLANRGRSALREAMGEGDD